MIPTRDAIVIVVARYEILRRLVGERDHFVLTSNVDGCFERAGWDAARVYTPQVGLGRRPFRVNRLGSVRTCDAA